MLRIEDSTKESTIDEAAVTIITKEILTEKNQLGHLDVMKTMRKLKKRFY